jgi:hypothetical protein
VLIRLDVLELLVVLNDQEWVVEVVREFPPLLVLAGLAAPLCMRATRTVDRGA